MPAPKKDDKVPASEKEENFETKLIKKDAVALQYLDKCIGDMFGIVGQKIMDVEDALRANPNAIPKTDLETNVDRLTEALKFKPVQKKLVSFFTCSERGNFDVILKAACRDDKVSSAYYAKSLAVLLDEKKPDVIEKALDRNQTLVGMNFIGMDNETGMYHVEESLDVLLSSRYKDRDELLSNLIGPKPTTALTPRDYEYMAKDFQAMTETIHGYLASPAKSDGQADPKNLLIYGPPGTGKTEITAALSQKLNMPAFLVGVAKKSDDGNAAMTEPKREDRLKALERAAFILRTSGIKGFLVIDESEDILRSAGQNPTGSKEYVNRLLNHLAVPVVYISNQHSYDPSNIRRISPCFSMDYMPISAKAKVIATQAESLGKVTLTREESIDLAAKAVDLSVADVAKSIRTISQQFSFSKNPQKDHFVQNMEIEIERALRIKNNGVPPSPKPTPLNEKNFHAELVSTNATSFTALRKNPAKLTGKPTLVFGWPGTGKTSLAQAIVGKAGKDTQIPPRVINWSTMKDDSAFAMQLEYAKRDGVAVIIDDIDLKTFQKEANTMERIHEHPYPVIFVGRLNRSMSQEEIADAVDGFIPLSTDNLTKEQTVAAAKKILNVDVAESELSTVENLNIQSIVTIRDHIDAIGVLGDKKLTMELMKEQAKLRSPVSDPSKRIGRS